MANYTLQPNEVVLYQGNVHLEKRSGTVELTLTNLCLAFVITTKKLFSKGQIDVETYPIEEIKFYNNVPQIKQKDSRVEVFLSCGEVVVIFESMFEARKFVNAAMHLLTGKTMAQRGADRVKGAVGLVDDTLGISTVGVVKNALENGIAGSIIGGFGKKSSSPTSAVKEVVGLAKDLMGGKAMPETPPAITTSVSYDGELETLKKLKELVDAGVLTQEEFDAKKKQLLGL